MDNRGKNVENSSVIREDEPRFFDIMIERDFGYNCQGRNQTEEEAFAIQEEIKNYFKLINLNFLTVKSNNALKDILKFLEKK